MVYTLALQVTKRSSRYRPKQMSFYKVWLVLDVKTSQQSLVQDNIILPLLEECSIFSSSTGNLNFSHVLVQLRPIQRCSLLSLCDQTFSAATQPTNLPLRSLVNSSQRLKKLKPPSSVNAKYSEAFSLVDIIGFLLFV